MSDVEWAQRLLPLLPLVLALVAGLVLARVVSGQA